MSQRVQGSFPTQIEPNPRKDVKVVTLRSEKELKESKKIKRKVDPPKEEAPTKKVTANVIDKGKDILTPKKVNVPFPQRLEDDKEDKEFSKFLEIFRKVHINISFVEKLEEFEVINLTKECSTVVLKKFPPKLKDPWCITILCTMGNSHFEKAL
ncbi:hypothetical protein CR513_12189, partial [Mucuna pruriens]